MIATLLIILHVAAGFTALVVAPIAMVIKKGGAAHKRWGRVYFWAMLAIFVTALGVLYFRHNVFLFLISIFAFYETFAGVRAPRRKNPATGAGASLLDYAVSTVGLIAGVAFIVWGVLGILGVLDSVMTGAFYYLAVVFGVFLTRDAATDLLSYRRTNADPMWWWTYHLDKMITSYIAAVTAFLVQNVGPHVPNAFVWLVWVAPGIIGGVGISMWVRYYKRKFAGALTRRHKTAVTS